ncbi:MAG TPA: DUF3106 domain-containing protein [Oceanipulchritudo sp.]|nr:DUF3106 domain-containing protein [Oceanipulchritudo sp.]
MKTLSFIRIICCALILIPVYLPGKGVAGGPGNGGMRNGGTGPGPSAGATGVRAQGAGGISSPEGLSTLDQFLSLDDEALEQLEATVRRIRQMSPGERRSLREQIARYRQMPEAEKRTLQSSWGRLDRDVRGAWREYMLGLETDEREAVREEMRSVPAEKRTRWRIDRLAEKGFLDAEETDS